MDITDLNDATAKRVRSKIDMQGGPYVPGTLCSTLQSMDFLHQLVSMEFLKGVLNRRSQQNRGPELSVFITNSPSMRVAISKASTEHSVILIPAGAIARLQVMNRLLLSYWDSPEPQTRIIASIMDRPFERTLPALLQPLFADLDPESDIEDWWASLDRLNDSIELDEKFNPDVSELNHLILSWILSHEFAHAARHHADIVARVASAELVFEVGNGTDRRTGSKAELARAMENEADRIAAYLTLLTMLEQVDDVENLPRGLLRAGYGVTAALALFDPAQISLQLFGKESGYAHPLLRQDAFFADVADCAEQIGQRTLVEHYALLGGKRCLTALDQLENDIACKRRFVAENESCEAALHALRHSQSYARQLFQEREGDNALTLRLNTLIAESYGEFQF